MRIIHTSNQWSVVSGQWPVVGDQQSAVSGQQAALSTQYSVLSTSLLMRSRRQRSLSSLPCFCSRVPCSLTTGHRPLATVRRGFTMMELLVVVVIIGILAGMVLGALQMARQAAREAKTKATIAKLNNIIMQRYESYMTRRVPIKMVDTSGKPLTSYDAARTRLAAIRDLMRMEMPERWNDISDAPATLPNGATLAEPALHLLYRNRYAPSGTPLPNADYSHAKCLFLVVSMGNPEVMEQFNQSEINIDSDGFSYFIDGWGKPIYFLRWAPGCSANNTNGYSAIQSGNATTDHDPFDPRKVDTAGFHLIPLIFSYGRSGQPNVNMGGGSGEVHYNAASITICNSGVYQNNGAASDSSAYGNITNHNIEQR